MARPRVYKGADDRWHCYYTVGKRSDGGLDRRHLTGQTRADVVGKIEKLEAELRKGHVRKVGASDTVAEWMEHWLAAIAPRRCRPSTITGYTSKVRVHIVPALGHHRLAKLRAEHVETYFARLEDEVAPNTALQIFRILSRALRVAEQRGKLPRNPCSLVDPPSGERHEVEPLDEDDVGALLAAAGERRERARWWVALGLGLRQGEALGLMWKYVDLDDGVLYVRKALCRRTWQHGCKDPATCAKRKCRVKPCKDGCRRHERACPEPCPADCTDHASTCPQRQKGGLADPKSKKSKRDLPLAPIFVQLLIEHRKAQREERIAAGPDWEDPFGDRLVFCQSTGRPFNPRSDWAAWKRLLTEAGVRDARLHDARHSAATLMFGEGYEMRDVQEWLGHAQIGLTMNTYTHILKRRKLDQAQRLGGALERLQPNPATTRRRRGA
jgi:integrase